MPEPLKLCFVNAIVLNELVLTDVFSPKRLPKGIVFNHTGNSFPTLYFNGRGLNNMVRVCTIKYVNGKDNNGLFLEIEDIDAGSVVLKQEDG